MTGLGSSTVSQAARGALSPATTKANELDANHDLVIRYLAKHQPQNEFAVSFEVFAEMAGCSTSEVKQALDRGGPLLPALVLNWSFIKVTHPAALAFLASHPFDLDEDWFPTDIPKILQTTPAEDRLWTFEHQLSQAYGARLDAAIELRRSQLKAHG